MIISFKIKNWMSFRDEAAFSMIASKERQHGRRLPRLGKYKTNILPIAAIYGGNASGKTNFFKALEFAREMIVEGPRLGYSLIDVQPFRLEAEMAAEPSRFCFELLIDETIYEFSFAATRQKVLEEKLVKITYTSEKTLYHRLEGKPNFDVSLADHDSLQVIFKGTRDNQLFLTNSVSQKYKGFQPIYDWFKNNLTVISPDSRFASFEMFINKGHPLYPSINGMLSELDTGITRLGGKDLPFAALPESQKAMLQEQVKKEPLSFWTPSNDNMIMAATDDDGELIFKKLVTYHQNRDGQEVEFTIKHESDGSKRLFHLLPAFLDMLSLNSKTVYVIDELDRSLHTLLVRRLLETYLDSCSPESRAQLLFTTHDVLLMDQKLLRRDEMWVTEREAAGASSLLSFSDYKDVRYDRDIRKSYLQGRLGGIPRILLGCALTTPAGESEEMTDGLK